MNLQDTKEAFLRWINSCVSEDQVDLLADIVAEFIINRFKDDKKLAMEIELATEEIIRAMADKKILIKRLYFQSLNTPSHAH
jgi:phage tail tape-measure protein